MKRKIIWLALPSLACASPHVFSVNDDILAFPQYEIIFSNTYISDAEASSRLSYASALSVSQTNGQRSTSTPSDTSSTSPESHTAGAELSQKARTAFSSNPSQDRPPDTYERMILDSKPYLCTIPQPPLPQTNSTQAHQAAEDEAAELARATDRGWDLLQEMTGQCLYFVSGWWSYSFCYSNSVKQFHQLPPGKGGAPMFPPVEDPTTPSYVLGKFGDRKINSHRVGMGGSSPGGESEKEAGLGMEDKTGATTQVQAKGTSSSRYLSQKLSGGTTCDLTGAPRRVEIQFHCHPQSADRIGWIKEVSTCSYLMVIYTPRLCDDVAFLPPREDKAEQIICSEVVAPGEEAEWEARRSQTSPKGIADKSRDGEEAAAVAVAAAAAAAEVADPPTVPPAAERVMVGGIEIGGMNLLGKDSKKLEIPPNFQPNAGGISGSHGHGNTGTPSNIELIAKMDPKEKGGKVQRISDEDLSQMGLDAKVVEAATRELEQVAGKKGWRLEVFEMEGGGREMRGTVEREEEGEDGPGEEEEYAFEEVVVEEGYGEEGYVVDGGEGEGEGEGDGDGDGDRGQEGSEEEVFRDEL